MIKCRCAMCGRKDSKANRNSLYRQLGCDELLPRGRDKIEQRRRLRRVENRKWAHL